MALTSKSVHSIRFDFLTIHERLIRANWCNDNLSPEENDGSWWVDGNTFYFRDDYDYLIFLLRWGSR